jgi:4-aminobutyrate aminotransferase/4-aminobutyrate aminotransferase/(S)-3-amino-2-methylpropionate transaminase
MHSSERFSGPAELLRRRNEHLVPWVKHFYSDPPQITRGRLQYLFDHEGREYLDFFAGVAVMSLGHSHPEVAHAAHQAIDTLQHTTTIYLTEPIVRLAETLARLTPGDLTQSFFTTSGSEANESAALLAATATGRSEFLALGNSLHGRTKLAMSLTGLSFWRADRLPVGGVHFAPAPNCYRCPLRLRYPSCELACARAVEDVIRCATSGAPAALIAEPIQGNGGIVVPPPGYFEIVREILDRYGALLIVDEVQTGFSRTGRAFGIEHHGVTPDVLTVAKALGNGFPIGAMITRPQIARRSPRPGASTGGGSPFTATVALAVLELHERERLAERARDLGDYMKAGLLELAARFALVGDVRGLGLMLGAELSREDGAPAVEETDRVLEGMKERGVLIGKTGADRNVLTFLPPLVIERSDIDRVLAALAECLDGLRSGPSCVGG